jgi:ABC-type Fe3+ transport system permease subunit
MLFQLCVVSGILVAQAVNIGTSQLGDWGWRISLGLAAVPGCVLLIGGLLLPETPNSLIERGYLQKVCF